MPIGLVFPDGRPTPQYEAMGRAYQNLTVTTPSADKTIQLPPWTAVT